MYEIIYSPKVQDKLAALKSSLLETFGNEGTKRLRESVDGFEIRLAFSNTGIPITTLYDVEPEFEKYFIIYSHMNYFLYYIEGTTVYVMEVYDEREDYAYDMFGIVSTSQESTDFWED